MNTNRGALGEVGLSVLKLILLCCGGVCHGQNGANQQRAEIESLREDISTLKKDVGTLGQRLQQVMEKLDELTKPPQASLETPPPIVPTLENIRGLPFRGNESATVVMIEYVDFKCPFCMKFSKEIFPTILANYIKTGKVKYVYRDFPLQMHSGAMRAARVARCAGEQGKLWELRDRLLADQDAFPVMDAVGIGQSVGINARKLDECLSSKRYIDDINQDIAEAHKMGVDRTPTFFLGVVESDNHVVRVSKVVRGVYPYDTFKADLDEVLASGRPQHSN